MCISVHYQTSRKNQSGKISPAAVKWPPGVPARTGPRRRNKFRGETSADRRAWIGDPHAVAWFQRPTTQRAPRAADPLPRLPRLRCEIARRCQDAGPRARHIFATRVHRHGNGRNPIFAGCSGSNDWPALAEIICGDHASDAAINRPLSGAVARAVAASSGTRARARDEFMFSSIGQIVGLIEIEPADRDAQPLDSLEFAGECEADAQDASLDDLLARLVGRPATHSGQTSRTSLPQLPLTSRLVSPATRQASGIVLNADLDRLTADLADEACRLRVQLAAAGCRLRGR